MACLRGYLRLVLRFVSRAIWELFKGLFGAVLWLFKAVYGLYKGLFGASFKVCLRGCLGAI